MRKSRKRSHHVSRNRKRSHHRSRKRSHHVSRKRSHHRSRKRSYKKSRKNKFDDSNKLSTNIYQENKKNRKTKKLAKKFFSFSNKKRVFKNISKKNNRLKYLVESHENYQNKSKTKNKITNIDIDRDIKLEKEQCRDSLCNSYALLHPKTAMFLAKLIPKSDKNNVNEASGNLLVKYDTENDVYIIYDDPKIFNKGTSSDVDAVQTKYNFHTHPEAAYHAHNCEMGWPSRDDYTTFLDGFFRHDTTFHIISTVEGIYILNINPCIIEKLKIFYDEDLENKDIDGFVDAVDEWADDNINISKTGLTRRKGLKAPDNTIVKDEYVYVEFVNNQICDRIKHKGNKKKYNLKIGYPLFHIEFREWPENIRRMHQAKQLDIDQGSVIGLDATSVPFRISKEKTTQTCKF